MAKKVTNWILKEKKSSVNVCGFMVHKPKKESQIQYYQVPVSVYDSHTPHPKRLISFEIINGMTKSTFDNLR